MNNNEATITLTKDNVKENVNTMYKVKKMCYLFVKRLFDIIISLIGIILLLPLTIIIKICYMVTGDFHSIFYTQKRVGKNGKIFKLFKFRSMVKNADEILAEKLKTDKKFKEEWDKYQKVDNDPRITKVGKLIRKLSLDECPQFINLLIGDMSLIGPRPLVPGELEKFNGNHKIYEAVRPGITGWWACNGRSATTYEERLALEYYYVKNCSLGLDIKCIFKTAAALVTRKGAK